MVRRSEYLHSLAVLCAKRLFTENSPDKGNTDTFTSCNSSHTDSGIFFSVHELPYWEFELVEAVEAFRDPTYIEQRIQIRSDAGEIW
jgi:hypothetical protein